MAAVASPAITVLFATHNGEQTLPRMLQSLRRMKPPRRPWRILAVDNASTDATAQILREAARDLPIEVLACPRPGKASALRHAVPHVTGDLVVLTDDDVEPCPDWLAAYEAAADAHPQADLFGGPITPVAHGTPGPWFEASAAHHAELFAKCQVADGPLEIVGGAYGPNFMLRQRHIEVLAEAPEHIGPRFDSVWRRRYPMGQDTRVMSAVAARGATGRGVAAAQVKHMVRPFQTELRFMLDRAMRHGRGSALELVGADRLAWARRLKLIARSWRDGLRPTAADEARPDPQAFERLWQANWTRGLMLGAAFGPFAR